MIALVFITMTPIDYICQLSNSCQAHALYAISLYRGFNDFVINVFHNLPITWNYRNMQSSAAKDAYFKPMHKTTNYTQKYLLSCLKSFLSILLFFENSTSKTSGLLFIFIHVSRSHAHFSNDEIHIFCKPERPTLVFFSWTPEKPTIKPDLMSAVSRHTCFLAWKRIPPSNRSLLVQPVGFIGPLSHV